MPTGQYNRKPRGSYRSTKALPKFKICLGCGKAYSRRPGQKPHRYDKQQYCSAGCHIGRFDRSNYKRPLLSVPRNPRKAIRVIGPSIAYIVLSQGKFSLVDAWKADSLEIFNWLAHHSKSGNKFYALRKQLKSSGKHQKEIHLHRHLTNAPDGMEVDHINGNGLDNRRANLRIVTRAQNSWNTGLRSSNTSGYKGIYISGKSWVASIVVNGKRYPLGSFKEKEDAAKAYEDAAIRLRKW